MRSWVQGLAVLIGGLSFVLAAHAGLSEGMEAFHAENYPVALKEFRTLAEQGEVNAQYYLGMMYASGRGAKDPRQAIIWFRKAAEQDYLPAQYNLGLAVS